MKSSQPKMLSLLLSLVLIGMSYSAPAQERAGAKEILTEITLRTALPRGEYSFAYASQSAPASRRCLTSASSWRGGKASIGVRS